MFQSFRQITAHVADEGVQLLGAIKSNRHNAVAFCDVDEVVHASFEFAVFRVVRVRLIRMNREIVP